ncbi:MAG TPA: PAS domain S-box protein, partial [Pirellulales bacterium]
MTTVLIVDDHDANLYLLRALLEGHGFAVEQARHGAEALTKARLRPPDLVVSDLLMPVLDGYALLRQWKTDDRLKDVPFIVYTATYTEPKDERLAMALGADAFVIKPSEPEVLMEVVRDVLEKHARGERISTAERPLEEMLLLKDYNEVLVRKLEKKALQLEQANRELTAEIEERKQAEAALRDSEDRYRRLFNAIADPLFVYDRQTLEYLAVNDAAVRQYGRKREECVGRTLHDVPPVDDVAGLLVAFAKPPGSHDDQGVWRRRREGAVMELEVAAHDLEYAGRPARVIQVRDVTEKRRAAAEAARINSLLHAVVDGSLDAVFVKDREGKYLLVNQAAAQFVGRPVEEVLGRDDRAIFDPESARIAMDSDRRVMDANRTESNEETLTAAGMTRTYDALKTPLRDAQGNVIGLIGISRDVTERKRAEEAIRQQQRLLRIAGRVARIGGWSIELPQRRVVWSEEISEIHETPRGYQPPLEDALQFYPPEYREAVERLVENCASNGTPFDVELELNTATGRRIWVRAIGEAVRRGDGRIVSLQGAFQDISDRKQAEDEQRRLAERLTTTLENISDGFFTVGRDWRFTYLNAEAERLMVRDRRHILGCSLWEAFPDAVGSVFEREYRRALEQNATVDFEAFFAPLAKWFGVRAYPSEQGLAVYFRDVTGSRALTAELMNERSRLVAAQAVAKVGSWETDFATLNVIWSAETYRIFNQSPTEFQPTHERFLQLVHPEDREAVNRAFQESAKLHKPQRLEHRIVLPDGSVKFVEERWQVQFDDDAEPVRVTGTCQDVTERKQSEEALRLRERAIQAVSQGILVTDPNQLGNPIVFANGGFERMTGYRADDVLGKNWGFLHGDETDPEAIRELESAVADARTASVEILHYRHDGKAFWNQLTITPVLGPAGQLTHFVGVHTDVTERRRLEEQYRQSQKMEAVGRLAGGVAHDFNNLLTVILGHTEILIADEDEQSEAGRDRLEQLKEVRDAGQNASALTQQLLAFSSKQVLRKQPISINNVVRNTEKLLRRLIGEDVQLNSVLDPDLWIVNADEGQLSQVLMNLAVNARDAMP